MTRFAVLALASLCLLSLSSCFEDTYEVAESEVLLRYLPERDELLVLEIEHGIEQGHKSEDPVRLATDALRGIVEGKRVYPASGEWMATDLDEIVLSTNGLTEQEQADLVGFTSALHVEDRGLYLEGPDRLSLFRLTRIERFRRVLEIVSRSFNRECNSHPRQTLPPEPEFPLFDEPSRELFRSAIAKDHGWLSIREGAIVLDVPMTSANAARCLAWIAGEGSNADKARDELTIYREASSVVAAEGHTLLRYCEPSRPVPRFTYHSEDADSSRKLITVLQKDGFELGGSDAPLRALARLQAPPAGDVQPK
jgi:hypothetical protein